MITSNPNNLLTAQVSVGVPAPAPLLLALTGLLGFWRRKRPDCLPAAPPR